MEGTKNGKKVCLFFLFSLLISALVERREKAAALDMEGRRKEGESEIREENYERS